MADLIYQATLDDKQVLAALKRIDANIDKMASAADRQFQGIGKSASASGVQIGAIAGATASVVNAFIQLGQQAISTLVEIGKQSVQTALEMDTLKARLLGIFDGSQEAADEAFAFIQDKSKELGIDLSELAGAFLPKTESLAQFERVAKIATALARSDPEQGAIGARIALIEALSGTFTSIQRRFEIPKEDINRIKEAFDKEGIEGFLTTLETVLAESGKSFEDLANTAQTSFDRLGIAGEQLGGRIGVPIVASLEEAANKLLEFIDANEEDLIVFADTIGRAIADVIDFIAGVDLGQLDTQQLIEFADYIFRLVNAIQLAVGQFTGFVSAVYQVTDAVTPLGELLDYLVYILANVDDALVTGSQIVAISKAGYIGLYEGIQPVVEILEQLYEAAAKAASGDLVGAQEALSEASRLSAQDLFDEVAAREASQASILESMQAIEDYHDSVQDNTDSQRALREELEETANAGTDAADAILSAAQAERQAAADAEKFAEAQEKVNEAFAKAKLDHERNLEDIEIKAERKRFDIALEFAHKREDAAKKNLEKIADLRRKNQQDITDAATDLERTEEDIARKFANERLDLETDQRQKRLDIETSFREKLQDIQRESAFDLEEAERSRDAVGFLRILRQRNEKVNQASIDRQREIDELRVNGERRKEELRLQQERELEEARIANERKIEDLRLSLERQIEEQNTAYGRELEDLRLSEERKFDEANRARERDIEDANRAYERKLEDLRLSLAEELAILEAGNAALEAEQERHNEAMAASRASSTSGAGRGESEGRPSPGRGSTRGGSSPSYNSPGFRSGGSIGGGRPPGFQHGGSFIVGGSGGTDSQIIPIRVTPGERVDITPQAQSLINQKSALVPPNPMLMSNMAPRSTISNISNSRSQNINFPVNDASVFDDPIFVARVKNIFRSELSELL